MDDQVKVLVVRGVGEDLGSGADLPEFMEMQDGEDEAPRSRSSASRPAR